MQGNCQKPDIEAYGPPARPGFEMNIILMVRTMIAKTKSMVMAMVMVILRVVTMVLAMAISFKN